MEIFDVVDEAGRPTGSTVERSEAHASGIRHRTAHLWLVRWVNGRAQILLQKRSAGKDSFPGRWDTSSAGHIPAGEEPLPSALRELREELGIEARPGELSFAGTFSIRYEKEFHGALFRDNEIAHVYVLERDVDAGRLALQTDEVERVDWFDLEDVRAHIHDRRDLYCVPSEGLELLARWLEEHAFRPMRRANQAMTPEECAALLKEQVRGVLSMNGDHGWPYGVPLDHLYDEETGHLFFHGGRIGHRVDAVKRCDRVSYCVMDDGVRRGGGWSLDFRCVIVFGRIRIVEDHAQALELSRRLSRRFTDDEDYIEREVARSGPATLCMELIPEHMTGKRINES